MKLKTYNPNLRSIRTGNILSVNRKSGQINLNASSAQALKIKLGDKVNVFQDEDNPIDWYVAKVTEGFTVRKLSASNSIGFCNKLVADDIMKSSGITENSARYNISTAFIDHEGVRLYPIITKGGKGNDRPYLRKEDTNAPKRF